MYGEERDKIRVTGMRSDKLLLMAFVWDGQIKCREIPDLRWTLKPFLKATSTVCCIVKGVSVLGFKHLKLSTFSQSVSCDLDGVASLSATVLCFLQNLVFSIIVQTLLA